jgi:hypothetical protein
VTAAPTERVYVAHAGDVTRDRDAVLGLWRGNLGVPALMEAKFDWFYRACPWGAPLLQLLRHEPSAAWVGVAGAGPRRMSWRGRLLTAGVLVDLTVTALHRSLGPALTLQKALLSAGQSRFDVLYGFPNPKAAAVFKRVGYVKLGDIVRHARVLRHARHLERVMPRAATRVAGPAVDALDRLRGALVRRRGPRLVAHWAETADARIDELWARSDHGACLLAARDRTMLRWRFDRAPLPKTRYLLVGETRGGGLSAWFACQREGTTLHVRDFWAIDAATAGIGRAYVEALLGVARREGYASVSVEYAGAARRREGWLGAGFVERTRRPVFGRWHARASAPTSEDDLHLTSADEDE